MVEGSIHPPCLKSWVKSIEICCDRCTEKSAWKNAERGKMYFLLIICCSIQTVSYMNWEFDMDGSSCWTFPYLLSSFTGTACFTHLCFLTHPPSRRYITLCLSGTQIAVWVDKRNGAHIMSPCLNESGDQPPFFSNNNINVNGDYCQCRVIVY